MGSYKARVTLDVEFNILAYLKKNQKIKWNRLYEISQVVYGTAFSSVKVERDFSGFFLQEYETANMSDIKLCQNTSIENMWDIFYVSRKYVSDIFDRLQSWRRLMESTSFWNFHPSIFTFSQKLSFVF